MSKQVAKEYPKPHNLDGIFFKVYRNNRPERVCISDLTKEEKPIAIRQLRTRADLENAVITLSNILRQFGETYDLYGTYFAYSDLTEDEINDLSEIISKRNKKMRDATRKQKIQSKFNNSKYEYTSLADLRKEIKRMRDNDMDSSRRNKTERKYRELRVEKIEKLKAMRAKLNQKD